jgi:trimethylamine--corrinoid protein Co-methyltransferase
MASLRKNWLQFLTEDEVKKIDLASRRVLIETGIRLKDAEITQKLLDQGCRHVNKRVQLTDEIINEALEGLPSELVFGSRNGDELHIQDGLVATHTGASIPFIYDLDSGLKRDATMDDLADLLRLMEHLDNLHMPGAVVLPQDIPPAISEIIQSASVFRYCNKPRSGTAVSTASQARYIVEMYRAMKDISGGLTKHPMMNVGISPESPLYYPQEIVDVMKAFIGEGIPTLALVAPILGLTAPMTISGGLTQMNASMLAYCVISRQINPDTAVVYGARLAVANMRTAHSVWGVPEVGMIGACSVQLARHYGLPSDVYGYSSTACAHDPQYGAEMAINGLLPMLAGANIISGFGSFGSGYMSSFEDLVFDDELFGMHLRVAQGIAVDEDHLAVDVIASAMNGKDYFLQPHTLKHLRTGELFTPGIGLYGLVKEWEEQGSKDYATKARERAKELLAAHEDMPLPPEVEREFERIISTAKKELL